MGLFLICMATSVWGGLLEQHPDDSLGLETRGHSTRHVILTQAASIYASLRSLSQDVRMC